MATAALMPRRHQEIAEPQLALQVRRVHLVRTQPQRLHSMRRNHDEKARRGSFSASCGVGNVSGAIAAPTAAGGGTHRNGARRFTAWSGRALMFFNVGSTLSHRLMTLALTTPCSPV
jgi:hypothetical protein